VNVLIVRRDQPPAGNVMGMAYLGAMYESGRGGLPKDDARAEIWYRKAHDAYTQSFGVSVEWLSRRGKADPKP
jgi:TPR repeat protein